MKQNDRTNVRQPAAAPEAFALDDGALEDVAGGLTEAQLAARMERFGQSEPRVIYFAGEAHPLR